MTETKRIALITGASSGIGEAAAHRLHDEGYVVVAGARRTGRMAGLAEAGMDVVALDVTDDDSMVSVVDHVVGTYGRIDLLVNNAGYGSYGAVEDVPLDEARNQVEVNLFGLARLTQLVLPQMRAQRSGRIVNISSIGGRGSEPLGGWYHATKYAVEGLSDALRMELRPFGIDVVIIEPGAIRTEWSGIATDSLLETSGGTAYGEQARQLTAFHRAAFVRVAVEPAVVADAVLEAATVRRPKARYVAPRSAGVPLTIGRFLTDRARDAIQARAMKMLAARAPETVDFAAAPAR